MRKLASTLTILTLSVLLISATSVMAKGPKGPSIVDVAIAANADGPFAGAFDTLIFVLGEADPGVIETLSGNGQFTVFAPTDDAFDALAVELEGLGLTLGDVVANTEYLTDVLLYHAARGRRYSEDILDSSRVRMLDGGFNFQDGGFLRDNLGRYSEIIAVDVEAANGVIHGINGVLLPYLP